MRFSLWQKSVVLSLILNIAAVGLAGLGFMVTEREQQRETEFTVDLSVPSNDIIQNTSETAQRVDAGAVPITPDFTATGSYSYSPAFNSQEQSSLSANGSGNYQAANIENNTSGKSAIMQNVVAAPRTRSREIVPPKVINRIKPRYPENARRQEITGTVKVKALVLTDGSVSECFVISSSGSQELDAAALKAVREWRFDPAMDKATGQQIRSYISLPVVFTLN